MENLIGWLATILTIISFVPKGERWIRSINGIACVVWIIYASILHQAPLIVVNGVVLLLHIIYFYREKRRVSGDSELKLGYGVYNNMGDKKPLSYSEYHKKRDQLGELWETRNNLKSEINKIELEGISSWAKWFGWKIKEREMKRIEEKIKNFK